MKARGIVLAWLVGEAIVIYRGAWKEKRPPWPSELLLSTGVFVALGILAEIEALSTVAVIAAWGFDVAAYLRLAPGLPANQSPGQETPSGPGTPAAPPIINNQGRTV